MRCSFPIGCLLLAWCIAGAGPAAGQDPGSAPQACPHHPAARPPAARYVRSLATYEVPDVTLLDQDGRGVSLESALGSGEPVLLNFVFTTCATICPVMTATFSRVREELGPEAERLRMVSISIDPDHDTPPVMKQYAERYGAGPRWRFLTGTAGQIARVLKAFDASPQSKADHRPLTFIRTPTRAEWLRIEGLTGAADLAGEYRRSILD